MAPKTASAKPKINPADVSVEDLAYAYPGVYASLVSGQQWFYGPHLKLIEDKLLEIHKRPLRLIIEAPPRHGKLVADFIEVFTILGWTTHGKLKVGDYVFGVDGKPTEVLAVGNPGEASLKVTFTDDSEVVCHPNHEWTVFDRSGKRWRTSETQELAKHKTMVGAAKPRARFQLPARPILETKKRVLRLPPYFLGVWLGDGHSKQASITYDRHDQPMIDAATKCLLPLGVEVGFHNIHREYGTYRQGYKKLEWILKEMNLHGNKHIPPQYLIGSIEQREQLLAGLIDSDGHVCPETGRVRFATTSPELREGIQSLIRSLGWRATLYEQEACLSSSGIQGTKTVSYVGFSPDRPFPTVLARKQITKKPLQRKLGIKSVEPHEPSPGRCIQVEAADGLYLAGRQMVPTHNSEFLARYFPGWFLGHYPHKNVILLTYQGNFSAKTSKKTRNDLKKHGPSVFGVDVSDDTRAGNSWATTVGGGEEAVGVGGAITGKGADLLVVDDIVKGRDVAMSGSALEEIWEFWGSDVYTRLEPNASVIVINCLAKGSRVFMADGTWKCIETVQPGELVWSHPGPAGDAPAVDKVQIVQQKVIGSYPQGKAKTLRITISSSRLLINATEDHPFLTANGRGYVKASELVAGDEIVGTWLAGPKYRGPDPPPLRKMRVAKIKPGPEQEVYDLSVEGTENYIAEGFVVHNTRWAEQDLTGRLFQQKRLGIGDDWEVMSFPALAEENDLLGRKKDEALWPARFDEEALAMRKANMLPFWWLSLYQQRPVPRTGNMLDIGWFRRYQELPDTPDMIVISWDTAQKEKELSDYTVAGVWLVKSGRAYLVDLIRDQLNYPDLLKLAAELNDLHRPHLNLVEDKGSGTSLIQHMEDSGKYSVFAIQPTAAKAIRFDTETAAIQSGRVYLPEDHAQPWVELFLEEVRIFPNGVHDDQADMLSQFLRWMRERGDQEEFAVF